MKNRIAGLGIELLAAYMRYVPLRTGKDWLWNEVIRRHFLWRSYRTVTRTRDGALVNIELPDFIQARILFHGVWEPGITNLIKEILAPGDVFIDVGANIGYYTLLAGKLVGPRGVVHGIEASPSTFLRFRANVEMNRLGNVSLHCAAVADKAGTLRIYQPPKGNIGRATTVPTDDDFSLECDVRADTLDKIVGADFARARLIKVDVEGAEDKVIAGIRDRLRQAIHTDWIIEIGPALVKDGRGQALCDSFLASGYQALTLINAYQLEEYVQPRLEDKPRSLQLPLRAPCDILFRRTSPA